MKKARKERDPELARRVVLRLCALEPRSTEELSTLLDRNRRYVLTDYVKPLLQAELLYRTHPETPKHQDQKYWAPRDGQMEEE